MLVGVYGCNPPEQNSSLTCHSLLPPISQVSTTGSASFCFHLLYCRQLVQKGKHGLYEAGWFGYNRNKCERALLGSPVANGEPRGAERPRSRSPCSYVLLSAFLHVLQKGRTSVFTVTKEGRWGGGGGHLQQSAGFVGASYFLPPENKPEKRPTRFPLCCR